MEKWSRIKYQPCVPIGKDGKMVTSCNEHIAFSRKAAGEGMVLLKNNCILPLKKGSRIAVFGIAQIDYVKGGGGSGNVYCKYVRNIYDGLKVKESEGKVTVFSELSGFYTDKFKQWHQDDSNKTDADDLTFYPGPRKKDPGCVEEPELPADLLQRAADFTDTAIITISRFSGEGWDRSNSKGDFYLSDGEERLVADVCRCFTKIAVVLNVGGVIDTLWFKNNSKIGAALLAWNGGMEGGLAVADILCGDVNPSGHLTDTFANSFDDYPSSDTYNESDDYVKYYEDIYVGYRYFETIPGAAEKVSYPFGYGLSYTSFKLSDIKACENGEKILVSAVVTNTGNVPGRQVVQVYSSSPMGELGKPAKELRAFKKTSLLEPLQSEKLIMEFDINSMASYDDVGKCAASAYVLEKGDYNIFVGTSIRDTIKTEFVYKVSENFRITTQLSSKVIPIDLEKRLCRDGSFELMEKNEKRECVYTEIEKIGTKPPEKLTKFIDVANGKITLDEFIAQLDDEYLMHFLGGTPNIGIPCTGCIGGTVYDKFGIPAAPTTDGPAGVRILEKYGINTTAWPCATLLACSWDTSLIFEIGRLGALEAKENNKCVWLTPAMNIHRSPLCGRNFEYFSEDPLLSGKMATAKVCGIQSEKIACAVKHFACNNKEVNRADSDSVVSERALREIYLKGFEICIKEADPWIIMTSYNLINSVRASENYDLITGILRNEWGFRGMVTTDWDNLANHSCEVKAGNDVRMSVGNYEELKEGNVTRGELENCARRILELLLKLE